MIPDRPWLLCAALAEEADLLIPQLSEIEMVGRRRAYAGRLGDQPALLLITGMGHINAAQAATAALERFAGIAGVISLGCAGAFAQSGLGMGQTALADEMVLADMGVLTSQRLHGLETANIPLLVQDGRRLYNRLPVDAGLSAELARANPEIARGAFASVGLVSGDAALARQREERWGVIMEEMEGGALALCAALYAKPLAALRGVSNLAGEKEFDLASGARAAQRALLAWTG